MSVQSGQSVTVDFSTRVFATGVGTNADSLPTGVLVLNGTNNAATVTVTNISTGLYKAQVTLPTLSIKDIVSIVITATVSGVTDSGVIWTDTKDIALDSSGDVTFSNTTIATVTNGVTVTTNNDKTGYSLSSSGVDGITVETGLNLRQAISVIASAVAGVLSGANTTSITIEGAGVATVRIQATVDSYGDRSVVVLTPPA